jgi:hypothetical protein
LIVLFFIPALWQRQSANPTLFFQNLWDGCASKSIVQTFTMAQATGGLER